MFFKKIFFFFTREKLIFIYFFSELTEFTFKNNDDFSPVQNWVSEIKVMSSIKLFNN